MKKSIRLLFCLAFACLLFVPVSGQNSDKTETKKVTEKTIQPSKFSDSAELQALLSAAIGETVNAFAAKGLKPELVAATLIDLREANNPKWANVRGNEKIYPASVVKMFYMVALHQWLENGKVKMTPELERGLRDMIVDSSNDATHYILDVLTDTPNGAEFASEKDLEEFAYKRNAVNRFFASLGYKDINVNQKTYCEDIYGRERQFWNKGEQRNMLTTNATARLLSEIVRGKAVTAERSKMMLDLLRRDPVMKTEDLDNQSVGFAGRALIDRKLNAARLWSKAGWTSNSRHDAAYIEMPDGARFVLVVFTEKVASEREIIPSIFGKIIDNLGKIK